MKQVTLFGDMYEDDQNGKYSKKIEAPIYTPKLQKPHIMELYDKSKYLRLLREIDQSNLPLDEKKFLLESAKRHIVFNYEKIADYYAHASKEMQELMERSALVIIDIEKAIQNGYVQLSDEIRQQYLQEYEK
jgi:hypothetical protein